MLCFHEGNDMTVRAYGHKPAGQARPMDRPQTQTGVIRGASTREVYINPETRERYMSGSVRSSTTRSGPADLLPS